MSKTLRRCLIAVVILVVLGAGGFWALNWMMSQPLYVLGSVSSESNLRGPLQPPTQVDDKVWQVESDIQLSFESHGSGEPVLIVHGGPGIPYGRPWKGLANLTDKHQFYYYHQRGCGDSTRPFDRFDGGNFYNNMLELEKTLGIGAQVADLERIRRILGHEKITLIGHSFGGFIAMLYAAEFPEHVKKLVLVAPAGVLTAPDEDRNLFDLARARLSQDQQSEFDKVMEAYFDFGSIFSRSDAELVELHERCGEFLLRAMGYDPDQLHEAPRPGGWAVFAMYFSLGRAPDYRPALSQITAPTLIVHGADDGLTRAGAETYKPIQSAKFIVIKRENDDIPAGHSVFDDSPTHFEEQVRLFLE